MNRAERRAIRSMSRHLATQRPAELTVIPEGEWPAPRPGAPRPTKCWQSRKYLVQLFENEQISLARFRLSICRVTMNAHGRWDDGISWQELQDIKREVGFGDWYAVEVYPRDVDVVDVANMRHLWICERRLEIGWVTLP